MALYNVTPLALEPGSVILPGNWGRIIRLYGAAPEETALLTRELAFELVRATRFQGKPSRLEAAFVFEDKTIARQHIGEQSRLGVLHEVELVEPTAPTHRAAYNLVVYPSPNQPALAYFDRAADAYWSGSEITVPELVTLSPLRAISRLG